MKDLFEPATVAEVKERIARVRPNSVRQWGKMTPAQMLAHCATGMQMATGEIRPKRVFIGRILGGVVKRSMLGREAPMQRNSPTAPELRVVDERDLAVESRRLGEMIDRFAAAGPAGCTTHPHPFFGRMTPAEWAKLTYMHLDHHLRQFSA
jgi:hypothetical protein